MNDLATKCVYMTVFVFTAGALLALTWSVLAGQWKGAAEAARIPLEDGDDLDDRGRHGDETIEAGRRAPSGS
jgi:hypothetical protein